MEFLYPSFLYALSAISIPILIHLFNFRKFKKIPFSNVRFLREVQVKTQSAQKLRHLIVLLMRILAIVFLVLAFAQPYQPLTDAVVNKGGQLVSVYVDNSFSMDAENEGGNLLEQAKSRAADIVSVYEPTDQFQLLTNSFQSREQRFINREVFLQRLGEIKPEPASRHLNEVFSRQRDLLNSTSGRKTAYAISDFQTAPEQFDLLREDTAINTFLIPLELAETENLYIDSIWFSTPSRQLNQPEELRVRIGNSGSQHVENVPLNLRINGVQKALTSFAVEAGSFTDTVLHFQSEIPGPKHAEVSLQDAPVSFDDRFYFYFQVTGELQILALNSNNARDYFSRLFTKEFNYNYQSIAVNDLRYEELAKWNLIILNELATVNSGLAGALNSFVQNGGSVFIIPAADADMQSYASLAQALQIPAYGAIREGEFAVSTIAREHPLFTGVFEKIPKNVHLPVGSSYRKIEKRTADGGQNLLSMRNGDSFLSAYERGSGKIYLCAVPLNSDKNNFAEHAIFVTTALRMAELSSNSAPVFQTIAGNGSITVNLDAPLESEDIFKIKPLSGDNYTIPPFKSILGKAEIFIPDQIQEAGNYAVQLNDSIVTGLGMNYARQESKLKKVSSAQLRNFLDEAGLVNFKIVDTDADAFKAGISQIDRGREYWKLCLILALVFLGLEVMLLRFWKN